MAIQNRRGQSADFVASKMVPGEFAVSQDNRKLYLCFTAGNVKEIAIAEDMANAIAEMNLAMKEWHDEVVKDTEDKVEDAEAWAQGTRGGTPVSSTDPAYQHNAKYYAENIVDNTLSIAGKAADAKKTGDEISDLKDDLDENIADLKSAIQYNAVYSIGNLIPNKYIDNATGNEIAYSGWSATDYIPVTSGQRIFIKSSRSSNYNKYYDSAKNAFAGGGVYIASGEKSIIVPDGAAFIRLSNTTEAMQSAIIKLLPETDITFSESGISADAKEVGQYINSTRNIFPKNEITHKFNQGKYYDSSLVLQSNSGSVYTDEIVCTGYQNVVIKTSRAIESNVTRCVGFKKSDDSIRNVFTLKSIVNAGWCKSVDGHFETTIPISTNEDKFYMSIQSDNTPTEIVLTPRISDVLLNPEVAYVSNDGNDANTGMDRNNAFKTIQKAIDRGAKVILVKEGTYAGFSMVEKNGITISVDPYYSTYTAGTDEDDPVIIIDGDNNQIIGVNLNRCCNCRFENIEVKNCKGIGFKVFRCEACVFTGCSAHDIGVDKTETSIGGFVIQYSNADFYDCVVYNIATTTAGAATGSYDGFNIHYTGVTNFYNCKGWNCEDDGISHHDACRGSIVGGEWHHCGKGGVASPTHGAAINISGVYSHDNAYGLYALASDAVTDRGNIIVSNSVFKNNSNKDVRVGDYYSVIAINCIYDTVTGSENIIRF